MEIVVCLLKPISVFILSTKLSSTWLWIISTSDDLAFSLFVLRYRCLIFILRIHINFRECLSYNVTSERSVKATMRNSFKRHAIFTCVKKENKSKRHFGRRELVENVVPFKVFDECKSQNIFVILFLFRREKLRVTVVYFVFHLFRISGLSIQKFLNKVSQLKFKIESGNFFSFDTLFCLLKQLPGELFMF